MKLTHKEAALYIKQATKDVANSAGTLRFGQALWNALPEDVTNHIHGTDNDFFYWTDNWKVFRTFYDHCVSKEV